MCDPDAEADILDFDVYGPDSPYKFEPRTWLDRRILRRVREDYERRRAEGLRERDARRARRAADGGS